ncbi:Hypothetical predicted protein [Cloeon dipterum]|uniref:Peptidase S1 domain-containing protein n=1 Tax=Cloeon dipterum TaxID=197152 RepID=A0A8S1CUP1_9INSE|nr:Hypothetical predicted protein [Cloeon dipterum]
MRAVIFLIACAILIASSDQKQHGPTATNKDRFQAQYAAYYNDPENKPHIDFPPNGTEPQPASAGVSSQRPATILTRIIGGALLNSQFTVPWFVFLKTDNAVVCGGSLISTTFVLTSANCLKNGSSFEVTAGGVNRLTSETNEATKTSTTTFLHPDFDEFTMWNDIGLVQVPTAFTLSTSINVVKLPTQADAKKSFASITVKASGYGQTTNDGLLTNFLQQVSLITISNAECASMYGTNFIKQFMLCTKPLPNKSICAGDYGGPLTYITKSGISVQIGISSFNSPRTCTSYPAGFTRVTSFLGWISTKTGIAIP